MLITLKSLLHTLLLPPGGPLLLIIAGSALLARRDGGRARRVAWTLLIAGIAALWLLATPRIADALCSLAQRYPALDLSKPLDAQAIVILGGGESTDWATEYGVAPSASGGLLERLNFGAFLARRTGLPVLVSGDEREAVAMQVTLERNFQLKARWVENHSRDTFQNAAFSAPLLKAAGVRRVALVTDGTHEWRAAHEFQSAGLQVIPAPEGIWVWHGHSPLRYVPNLTALSHSTEALYELMGDVVRRALIALDLRRQTP
jgi:uncharacterized SAM-binding protein YcdF (DUF218 family)